MDVNPMKPLFEHACVINLDSRPDRWALMQANLKQVNLSAQRFAATSIQDVQDNPPPQALRDFLLQADGESPKAEHKLFATWACLHSHLAVIRHAQQEHWDSVLILEDDCVFQPYTPAVLKRVAEQIAAQNWDLVYLGGTLKKGGLHQKVSSNLYRVNRVRLAHAYVVRSSLYAQILQEAPQSGLPIDWYYSEQLLPRINAYWIDPLLTYQRYADLSDIEQVKRTPKLKSRKLLRHWLALLRYGRSS